MIYIFIGEDMTASRKAFINAKNAYIQEGFEINALSLSDISELQKWLYESEGLFKTRKVFFGENILSKKEQRKALEKFDTISSDIDINIWEEKIDERVAKFFFKNAKIISHKLPVSIFNFLDSIYPENLKEVSKSLLTLTDSVDENIVFFMTIKRVRELMLLSEGKNIGPKIASWQKSRLINQMKKWPKKNLISFYDALFRIEVQNKTSTNYFSLKEALDILFCYYVR